MLIEKAIFAIRKGATNKIKSDATTQEKHEQRLLCNEKRFNRRFTSLAYWPARENHEQNDVWQI